MVQFCGNFLDGVNIIGAHQLLGCSDALPITEGTDMVQRIVGDLKEMQEQLRNNNDDKTKCRSWTRLSSS